MNSESIEHPGRNSARCRVRHGRVFHSVELINISFGSITIIFSGKLDPGTRVEVFVPDFPPKTALVAQCRDERIDLNFEDPIPWSDLTAWCAAARR